MNSSHNESRAHRHTALPSTTLMKFEAIPESSPYVMMMDGVPIDEQATWLIPVVRVAGKEQKSLSDRADEEDYVSPVLKLVKNSGIYALSSLAAPFVSLVLAPFLTHHLSHSDYGVLAILNTFIALAAGITQLGISASFFRLYSYDYESLNDRMAVLSTTVMLLLLVSVPIVLIVMVAAPWMSMFLLNSPLLSNTVKAAIFVVLVQNLSVPGLAVLRADSRATLFTVLSIGNLIVTLIATLVCVNVLHMGIVGALIALGGGYAVMVVGTLPAILVRAGVTLRFDIAWGLLTVGIPHVMNMLSGWVLQMIDRYLLGHLGSLSQTASYAVAYSLGGILSTVIIMPFSLAWWVSIYSIAKREDARYVFQRIFRWFCLVLLFATFGLSLFGVSVLDLLFPVSYHAAGPIIPVIALSIMFNGIYVITMVGPSLRLKLWLATVAITCSALLNVVLNILLIPHYGAMGAAIATLVAYAALAIIGYVMNQSVYPIPFEIGRCIFALFVGIFIYAGDTMLAQDRPAYIAWGMHGAALVLYGMILLFIGIVLGRNLRRISSGSDQSC